MKIANISKKTIKNILIATALIVSVVGNIVLLVKVFSNYSLPDFSYEAMRSEAVGLTEGADVRIMSYNVLVGSWGGYDLLGDEVMDAARVRSEMLAEVMLAYQPDVIALQEFSAEWKSDIYDFIGEYTLFEVKNSDYTTLAYNSNTTELLESGRVNFDDRTGLDNTGMRYVEWGYFKDIATQSTYVVTNTHLDFGEDKQEMQYNQIVQTKEVATMLAEQFDTAVFITGDFNAREWGDTMDAELTDYDAVDIYEYLLKDNFSIDAKYQPEITTYFDSIDDFTSGSWDHIYIHGEATVLGFGQMSSDYFKTLSDHYPIFADIKL